MIYHCYIPLQNSDEEAETHSVLHFACPFHPFSESLHTSKLTGEVDIFFSLVLIFAPEPHPKLKSLAPLQTHVVKRVKHRFPGKDTINTCYRIHLALTSNGFLLQDVWYSSLTTTWRLHWIWETKYPVRFCSQHRHTPVHHCKAHVDIHYLRSSAFYWWRQGVTTLKASYCCTHISGSRARKADGLEKYPSSSSMKFHTFFDPQDGLWNSQWLLVWSIW